MVFVKKVAFLSLGALLVLAGVFGYSLINRNRPTAETPNGVHSWEDGGRIAVKTIAPKLDKNFVRSITAPAFVEAYQKADLFAHIAGPVKYIQRDIGDFVKEGDLLVEIDIPDLIQEIAQKDALVHQAEADRNAAAAHVQTFTEALETAKLFVPEKEAHVEQLTATKDLRYAEWQRFKTLEKRDAVLHDLVEERERDFKVSVAACKTAQLAIATARSEIRGAQAKLEEAKADLKVKDSRILVAQKEKDRVQALADFARIRAPWSGVITHRYIDVGAFVQNATTAKTEPMLTLMRTDIVTVCTFVPERLAGFIRVGQDATIYMEYERGRKFKNLAGKVARFSPTLDAKKGRTKRVEVDLYNPPLPGFNRSVREGVCSFLSPLGASHALAPMALWEGGRQWWNRPGLLQDGMYGTMKVVLQRYKTPYLIPSAAVFNYQGKTCIMLVRDHVVHRVPVQVQLEDGIRAKVAIIEVEASPESGDEDITRDLTGEEEVIPSGQGELAEGQEVRTVVVPW